MKITGFTLLELMIVIAIIAIIAAIAIPNMLHSRLAANETAAVAACKAFAEAEEVFHRTDFDGDGVYEYASRLSGNYSLLEKTAGSADLSLIDKAFANAEGAPNVATVRAGYVFTVLTSQGASASGGVRNYFKGSDMLLGYAMSAIPGAYDGTGRNTFVINQGGTIYQADRGSSATAHPANFDPVTPLFTPAQ